MNSRLINYQYNQILTDVTKQSNRYFSHLITAFESALHDAQPGSRPSPGCVEYESHAHLRNQKFHIDFANKILAYEKNIFADLNIKNASLELSSIKLEFDLITEMQKSIHNLDSLDNVFKDDSTHPFKVALDFITYHYAGTDVKDIIDKLKTFSNLQRILLTEEMENKEINPALSKLEKFKETLMQSESLDKRRHHARDVLLGIFSSLLFPIALGRSIYNLNRNGTWHFMWSDGKKLREKLNARIAEAEQLEPKPIQNLQEPTLEMKP